MHKSDVDNLFLSQTNVAMWSRKNIVGCVINQLSVCQTVRAVLLCLAVIKSGIIDRYFIRDDLVIGKIGISFKKNFAFFCVQHVKLYQIFTFFPTKNYPFLAKL